MNEKEYKNSAKRVLQEYEKTEDINILLNYVKTIAEE